MLLCVSRRVYSKVVDDYPNNGEKTIEKLKYKSCTISGLDPCKLLMCIALETREVDVFEWVLRIVRQY